MIIVFSSAAHYSLVLFLSVMSISSMHLRHFLTIFSSKSDTAIRAVERRFLSTCDAPTRLAYTVNIQKDRSAKPKKKKKVKAVASAPAASQSETKAAAGTYVIFDDSLLLCMALCGTVWCSVV